MSTENVELRDSNVSPEPQKRRRSVHFDSCAKTVLVPGESEDAELRGRGTGHFSSQEEQLIKKELPGTSLPLTIADETAEKLHFELKKSRRKSQETQIIEDESEIVSHGRSCDSSTENANFFSHKMLFQLTNRVITIRIV